MKRFRESHQTGSTPGRIVETILLLSWWLILQALPGSPAIAQSQDSTGSGLEKFRRMGEDPSMTRIVPDIPPAFIPPYPKMQAVPAVPSSRKIRLSGREAIVNSNIWIHPNPGTSQTEISVTTHPVNPDVVFVGSNSILSGATSIVFGSQGWYYTSDGGATWSGSDTLPTHTSSRSFLADPAVNIDLDSNLFFGAIRFKEDADVIVDRAASPDGEWKEARIPEVTEAEDKQHTVVDRSLISPFRNRLYTVYTDFDSIRSPYPLMFSSSTSRGADFSSPVQVSDTIGWLFAQGGNIATGPGGEVYVAWSGYDEWPPPVKTRIGFNRSTDGGLTWRGARSLGTIEDIRGFLYKGQNVLRVNSFPSMAVDISDGPRRGWLYLVYAERNPVVKVWLMRSTDGGETWSDPVKVGQELPHQINDQWFPWVCVDPVTGALYVVYYDSRNSTNNDSTDVFVSTSMDGGSQFEDIRVNDVSFVPTTVPGASYGYMGDYIGIAALNGIVWPAWNDNRTGIHQAYTSRIEFQNVASSLQLTANPDPVDAGRSFLGFPETTWCNLRNSGISDTIVVTGIIPSAPWISVGATTARIAPGRSARIPIVVRPDSLGLFSGTLTVSSNDPLNPVLVVQVRVESVSPPLMVLAPDSMHAVLATGDTVFRTITVKNTGAGDLHLVSATSIIWMDAIPRANVIPPGDSTQIDITLKSGELNDGVYRSYITLTSNDPLFVQRRIPVTLRINGIPRFAPEAGVVALDDVPIGYPLEQSFRISNTGTYPLSVSGFEIPYPGFTVTPGEPMLLAPHSSKNITIRFAPAVEESVNTFIRFETNDPMNPEVAIPVRVFGYVPPRISVNPDSFGVITYREDNTSAIISLFNAGSGTLHWRASQYPAAASPVTGVESESAPSGVTANWVTLYPESGTISAGRAGAFELRIDARALLFRNYLVEIIVSSNDPDRPAVRIQVIVTVRRFPSVALAPNVVTFSGAYIGYPDTAHFSIRNLTSSPLTITGDSTDNPHFALAESLPISIAPNSERMTSVSYTPAGPSLEMGTVWLITSSRITPLLGLTVQGTGVYPPLVSIVPDSVADPEIFSGDTTTRTIHIGNPGSSTLTVSTALLPFSAPGSPGATPSTPSADVYLPCTLRDRLGYKWDIQKDGSILDGTDDAFDGGFRLDGFPTQNIAATEDAGRELVIGPARTGTILYTRKIFVSEKSGFIRYLEFVQNDNILPVNVDLLIYSNLGSDIGNSLIQTSSGDSLLELIDNWVIADDIADAGDPAVVEVFSDDAYHPRPSQVSASVGVGNLSFAYRLVLPAQSRAIVMHFGAQRRNLGEAAVIASSLSALKGGALEGMSPEERSLVVNFGIGLPCIASPTSLTIPAGSRAPLSLRYDGSNLPEGLHHPVLRLSTNAPGFPVVLYPLSLTVHDAPHIAEISDTLRISSVLVASEESLTVSFRNSGSIPLTVPRVDFSHPDFRILTHLPCSVDPGLSGSLRVAFRPADAGPVAATMSIHSNDPINGALTLHLVGSALPRPVVRLSVDTLQLRGDEEELPSMTVGIRNTGQSAFRYVSTAEVDGVEEIQEGSTMWELQEYRTRGNIFHVTKPTILQEFRSYLDIEEPTIVDFVVGEANAIDGVYHIRHRSRDTVDSFGQGMVSSGPVGFALVPGNFYLLGTSVHGSAPSYYRVAPFLVPVSFGEIVSAGFVTMMNLPDSFSVRRQTYTIFHQSVITDPAGCVPVIVPATGVIEPGDSATIGVSLPFALASGTYHGSVQFRTIDPVRTLATLPVVVHIENPPPRVPDVFALQQNFPNPFNTGTIIRYHLAEKSRVTITVFNVLGQVVETLLDGRIESEGAHDVRWESATPTSSHASGVYFYKLEAAPLGPDTQRYTEFRKMLLLK